MIYRRILAFIIFFVICITIPSYSSGSETYTINGNTLLLPYKFISWWYDCPSEQFKHYCESRIHYKNTGVTIVNYNKNNQTLKLIIDDSFENMISIFNHDEKKLKHSILKPTYLNEKYFGSESTTSFASNKKTLKYFKFSGVKQENYQTIKSLESGLGFELEGYIFGLTNGKLALYSSKHLQRGCRENPQSLEGKKSSIILRLFNSLTDETLATYSIINYPSTSNGV